MLFATARVSMPAAAFPTGFGMIFPAGTRVALLWVSATWVYAESFFMACHHNSCCYRHLTAVAKSPPDARPGASPGGRREPGREEKRKRQGTARFASCLVVVVLWNQ